MACKDAGLDDEMRGDLIEWYTFGEHRSGKSLDDEQAGELFLIAQKIRTHKVDVRYDEKGKLYLEGDTTIKRGPRGS